MTKAVEEIVKSNDYPRFGYMMLGRWMRDCEYFLSNDRKSRSEKHLWANNIDNHIQNMKDLYNHFSKNEAPEWLDFYKILEYERMMKL